jgi:hypothetical protein
MERLGWFFNNEWAQRNAINEAASEIDALRSARSGDAGTFARLFALDRAQAQDITAIKTTLEVLSNLLIEAGIVDEKALRYRIEAAYAELAASQPPQASPSAYETLGAPPPDDPSKP